ncbi:MAG TPA: hypothetical protein VEV19_15410 [Ktedonobacteraceae bacterium]|nr:hypothetical protein [Ktedonobacteraceae bacterium]
MAKERFERRAYRRSPGRQYGYDYDPLGSQKRSGSSQSGRVDSSLTGEQWPSRGNATSQNLGRSSGPLAPRPDPRRTRQLLRQNILASKTHSTTLPEEETEEQEEVVQPLQTRHVEEENELEQYGYEEEQQDDSTLFRNRYPARNRKVGQVPPNRRIEPAPYEPMSEEYVEADRQEGDWDEFEPVDPDLGYEDPLDQRVGYAQSPQSLQARQARQAPVTTSRRLPPSRRSYEEQYDEEDYADEEDEEPARRKAKKGGLSRRKLLVGLGLAAAGGVAAYELGPKIPQAINDVGTNLEHQLQDAYNKGLAAGAEAVRKEFITSLNNLEGVSLQGAIGAARLTRLAYDAFVSPLVTLAATVTGDFLNVTLQAVMSARGFLVKFNQDNSTLAALQTVLATWVKQVNEVPKEIQTITDADLDGAQAYLRALQRKIQDETNKLNNPQATPTTPKATPTPKH